MDNEVMRMKHVYDQAKDQFKASKQGGSGRFITRTVSEVYSGDNTYIPDNTQEKIQDSGRFRTVSEVYSGDNKHT